MRSIQHQSLVRGLIVCILPTLFPAGEAAAASGADALLEELIVTARKREEGLQDTPISISAFSGEGLEYRGVTKVSDIAAFTPNLSFQNNPGFGGASNSAAVFIRGVGQKDFAPTLEPGVGLYVDGVYISRSVGAVLDLVEVERVEVLRGPQGTLFGRNTIGGAISITTRKPDEELGGLIESTLGSDERVDFKGSLNLPLTDNLFSRFSLASFSRDGYLERADGVDLGDDDTLTGRAALRWIASEDLEFNLSAEVTRDRENGPAISLLGINLGFPTDPNTPPFALIHNVGASQAAGFPPAPCASPAQRTNLTVPGCYDYRYVQGADSNFGTDTAKSDADMWAVSLNAEWQINQDLTLKSITGYRDLDSQFSRDGDQSPHLISQYNDDLTQQQFTQEINLLGSAFDDRLNWILGMYYFEEEGDNPNLVRFVVTSILSGGHFENENYAAFAQGTYEVTDKLSVTLGMRYTDETKTFLPDQYIVANPFAGSGHPQFDAPILQAGVRTLPMVEKEIDIQETTPMLNIAYQWTSGLMTYATYSEGFKGGGFTQRVFPPIIPGVTTPSLDPVDAIPSFEPETVDVYEVGFKYAGYDNRLRINGAAFLTTYEDMQVSVFTGIAPVTKNAGEAEIKGFELEMKAASRTGWAFEAAAGYLDGKYTDIDQQTTFIDPGNDLDRLSEWSISASLAKDIDLGDLGQLIPHVDWSYRSAFFNDTFNTPEIAQGSYSVVNANVAWRVPSQAITVVLGVSNLTDENHLVTGIAGDAQQAYEGVFARGREYYLRARYDF